MPKKTADEAAHEAAYTEALEKVKNLFGDTKVPARKTRESLENLRDEIDQMLESLGGA